MCDKPWPVLSAVIIARDEADRIGEAIRSVAFADECLVLDSGSRDDTPRIAAALGARVIRTDWPGHVAQKNRAFAAAAHDWCLSLDADERVSPALAASIQAALRDHGGASPVRGFRVRRRNLWLGHPLRGGHWYPDARVRLAHRRAACWVGQDPHDLLHVDGAIAPLEGDLIHLPYRSLADHLSTIDRYTAIAARELRASGRRARWSDLWLRPFWRFFSGFILSGGFRDGFPGLLLAGLGSLYCALKWARVAGIVPMPAEPRPDRP